MSKNFSAGSVSIDLSDDLQRFVDRVIKEVSPNTAKAIGDEVAELRQYAQKNWPVKAERSEFKVRLLKRLEAEGKLTGGVRGSSRDSRGKWRHGVRMTPNGIEGFVENFAPYAAFIREISYSRKPGKHQFRQLLFRRFGAKRQRALFEKIEKELG
tara:strand:- start:4946 stop:5410 length:465 start_codon:yes stop_codon:yes gene_type:complete